MAVGTALGFAVCSMLQTQRVEATATSAGFEGTLIATGRSANESVEQIWLLDERGMLSCFMMGQQGRTIAAGPVDIKQYIKGKGGKKGKYAMVTGRYVFQGQISDLLYVTESTSNSVAVFNLTNDGVHYLTNLQTNKP
jgi:hypothetical protein